MFRLSSAAEVLRSEVGGISSVFVCCSFVVALSVVVRSLFVRSFVVCSLSSLSSSLLRKKSAGKVTKIAAPWPRKRPSEDGDRNVKTEIQVYCNANLGSQCRLAWTGTVSCDVNERHGRCNGAAWCRAMTWNGERWNASKSPAENADM